MHQILNHSPKNYDFSIDWKQVCIFCKKLPLTQKKLLMPKVLVVDDDTDLLDMVSLVLNTYNMHVDPLDQCLQFQSKISENKPDIVLMDVYLGDCDGRKLCHDFKKTGAYADIPVILYSAGNVTEASINESLADEFMSKPFDIQRLVSRINHYVGSKDQ